MTHSEESPAVDETTSRPPGHSATVYPRGSTEFDRALAFTDAIFGFSITLLIASVDVPPDDAWKSVHSLLASGLGSQLTAFGISFVVVAAFWRTNHRAIASFRALDPITLRVSIVLVGLVVFIPFTTRAISTSTLPLATALYAVNIALVVLTSAALVAIGRARHLTADTDTPLLDEIGRELATAAVFLASIPVAYLVDPNTAMLSWLSLLVIDPVVDHFTKRRRSAV